MSFNDRDAALLAAAVYYESGEREDMIPPGYKKVEDCCVPKTGFYCVHYLQEDRGRNGGLSVFSIMGTNSAAGKEIAKGQMMNNMELRKDPDHNLGIIEDAEKFIRDATSRIQQQKGGSWKHYLTGHSLGGTTASCVAVACADVVEKCVTFESPGMIKFWRDKALRSHDEQYWKEHIVEYVSFPNPINTCLPHLGQVYRMHMFMHQKASPGHVIRCVVGSSLRFIVWVSLANVAAAATGRTKGFWAAKVGSVAVKFGKLLLARQLTPHCIKQAFLEGINHDQASKDSRAAEKAPDGDVDDPGAKPMVPILRLLPSQARPAFIVGFWAIAAAAGSNTGYVSMRTIAQINDAMAEHNVDLMSEHFDEETGQPKSATKMKSWPYHKIMMDHDLPGEHFRRCILEGMTPFHPTAYGMHNLFNRQQLLLRRASTMPNFVEQDDDNACQEDEMEKGGVQYQTA